MQAHTDNPIALIVTGEQPTVRDLDIGARLGMQRPDKIRQVIQRNRDELETYGPLASCGTMVEIGSGARREVTEYHLNEEQALCVCALSRAPQAKKVRHDLISVFMAYRRGQLVVATPAAPAVDLKAVGGVVKAVLIKQGPAILGPLVEHMVAEELARDQRRSVTAEFMGASDVLKPFDVPKKGRRSLVIRASASLRRFSNQQGKPMRQSAETGRWLYHVDAIAEWLDATGRQMIAGHKERHGKQPNLFPISGWKRYRPEPPRPSDNRPSA